MRISICSFLSSVFRISGIFFLLLVFTTQSQMQTKSAPKEATASDKSTAVLYEDFYSAGQTVDVKSDTIVGDVALAGMNVNINGKVEGYAMVSGLNVNIDGPISDDVWAAGANITVNSPIADNAMIAGSNVALGKNASIGRDAKIAGNNVEINGRITRNLELGAALANLNSEVGGNVTAHVQQLNLNSGAIINGDLIVFSPNEPNISSQATVKGRIDYQKVERRDGRGTFAGWIGNWFLRFLWLSVLGLVCIFVSTFWTNRVTQVIEAKPGPVLLTGFIAVVSIPVAIVVLLLTVIGLPLGIILGAMFVMALLLAGVWVSYFVGGWVLRKLNRWTDSNIARILIGAFLVTLACSLPFTGWLAQLLVIFFGFGAFILERRDFFLKLRGQGLA